MIKKLFYVSFLVLFFGLGVYYSNEIKGYIIVENKAKIQEEKTKSDELNFSLLNQINKILDEKFVDTREDKSKPIDDKAKIYGAAKGFVEAYDDPYTSFFPPDDGDMFKEDIEGEFYGVGMEVGNRDGYLMVINPLPNSPAQKAGLRPKDLIYKIDGKESLRMPVYKAVKLIRGKKGEKVKLTIIRKGRLKPFDVEIVRDKIKIPIGKAFKKDGVFVIKIYSFSDGVSKWFFKKIVKDFREAKTNKLIIDLRDNPGGLLNSAVFIAGLFLEEGVEVLKEDYQGKKPDKIFKSGDFHLHPDKTTNIFKNLKLGILINNGSASASEILAGTLMSNGKAILLGEKSFGKGTVQEMVNLPDGSMLKVTVAKFILPNGEWISYKGIEPDVEIEMPEKEYEKVAKMGSYSNYVDSQLMKAIKYMKGIKNQKDFENRIEEFKKQRELKKKNKEEKDLEDAQKYLEGNN